ncbi:MAG: hypothetical protein ACR2QB_10745 [Gammaproteobacteria bacterium]
MRALFLLSFSVLLLTACGGEEAAAPASAGSAPAPEAAPASAPAMQQAERGGTITVGEESWVLVPKFCSVYPGPIVNIAGHAKDDPSLEIVIDHGGPNQIVIGSGGREALWYAMKDTIKVAVDGKKVQGTASFNRDMNGLGDGAEGSFEINCGK